VFALFKKEISSFFGSLTGYIVVIVFLVASGLFLWVLPGSDYNILDNGYADLGGFFLLAPWLFLFLIPAVTMRMFAEEQRTGTIELLLSKPITDLRIVAAKYASAVVLAFAAIIPSAVYFLSLWLLAAPAGNVDTAGTLGSYFGLLFLCSGFASIGIFSSVLTGNQLISFIIAVILSFFFYSGFEFLAGISGPGGISNLLSCAGMSNHYESLSRGVIDTRDVVYFITLTLAFIFLSRFMLEKRKW
jgi:ABC-2 type transport system permease protein